MKHTRRISGLVLLILLASTIQWPQATAITPQQQTISITNTHDDMFITEVGIGIDSQLCHITDPNMDIRSFLAFRELEINYWEPLENATLRFRTTTTLDFDADSAVTVYGMRYSDLQREGWLNPSWVLTVPFTSAYTNYNTSQFYGQTWHEIDVTAIVEELIRSYDWDGDGHAGTEIGDAIGFIIVGAEGHDTRWFIDYLYGTPSLATQLVLHWNWEPPPPTDPPAPNPVFVEQYGNYTIWSIGGVGFEDFPGWDYRKSYDITGSTFGAVTDYQVPIDIYYGLQDFYIFASNGVAQPIYPTIIAPSAIYYNGVTYIVWQGGDNTCDPYAISYNHTTDTWSSIVKIGENPLNNDDHGAPSLAIDASGYLHVFYGCHSETPGYISHEKSDNPENITAWTAQPNIVSTEPTYTNPVVDGNNIWLFYRSSVSHAPDRVPEDYRKWNGTDWEAQRTIIDPGVGYGVYLGSPILDGVKIHMCWVEFDEGAGDKRFNQYHAYFNTTDEHMYDVTGTDLGITINKAEADASCMVVNSGAFQTNHSPVKVDGDGYPHIIYIIEKVTGWEYDYIKWNGTAWSTPQGITTDMDNMFNFLDFTMNSPTDFEAYLTTTGEAGRGGDLEKWVYDGASWTKNETIITEVVSGLPLNNPKMPLNHSEELELVFGQTKIGDYGTHDLNVYVYGSDFIGEQFNLNGNCETDFADIRFTDDDGMTELDYWREEYTSSGQALFWVKVPNIPPSPENTTIYIYYGNSTVGTTSSHIDTMIRADNGTTGNFIEATAGTTTLTYAGDRYKCNEDSIDDAFASGTILTDWNFHVTIRKFGAFTDVTTNDVMFGLYDVADISDQVGTQAQKESNRRFQITRRRNTPNPQGQLFYIMYVDGGAVNHWWNGTGWDSITTFTQAGDVEIFMYSNSTHLFTDILTNDQSILPNPAIIAISSTYEFSLGRGLMWTEFYTDFYKVNQGIERYFVRKYVAPEPALGDFEDEALGGDLSYFVADTNGTVLVDDLDSLDDAEDWIDTYDPDPLDPDPPGWPETGGFTRFRIRLYFLVLGLGCLFGPILFFASGRGTGYYLMCGFIIMLIGIGLLMSIGDI